MHDIREHVEAGGLISYGPDFPDLYRRRFSRWQDTAWGKAGGYSGQAADQIRFDHQRENRKGARPSCNADVACPRQRDNRI